MPDTTTTNLFDGLYPSVFKKIDNTDIQVNGFQAYKSWTVISGSSTSSCLPLTAIYNNLPSLPSLGTTLTYNDATNIDGSLQTVTYYSVNHMFYKRRTQPYDNYSQTDLNFINKGLFESASILSFPQKKIGEGIKVASFKMTGSYNVGSVYSSGMYGSSSYASTGSVFLYTDRYGNVLDQSFNTASIINDVIWYEGFNEYFDISRITYESNNISYVPGVPTTTNALMPVGLSANFSSSSYIKYNLPGVYNRDKDYAISFYISGANITNNNQLVLAKASSSMQAQYPFQIQLSGSNQLIFDVAGTTSYKTQLTSSALVNQWTHVLCQKTGSSIEMYINGTLHASASNLTLLTSDCSPFTASDARIDNQSPLYIGGYGSSSMNLNGKLDEIRIYNKSLTTTEIGYLADRTEGGTFIQTATVGNIFEKQGVVVLSTVDYRYKNLLNSAYTASYQSTKTLYEMAVTVRIDQGDYNMSTNVSLTKDDNITYRCFVSGSDFAPYITSIGLYDQAGQLLAIGKLAQPVRKRIDVDMNFLIRIDLDRNLK
jgi:hypothetical protein